MIDLLVVATTRRDQCHKPVEDSLQDFPFKRRIVALDQVPENGDLGISCFDPDKWDVINKVGYCRLIDNLLAGLKYVKSKWLMYCEEDVIVENVPSYYQLHRLEKNHNVRSVCFNVHSWDKKPENGDMMPRTGSFLLKQPHVYFGGYMLCFPVILMHSKLFKELAISVKENYEGRGFQIEQAFTEEWYKRPDRGEVAIYAKSLDKRSRREGPEPWQAWIRYADNGYNIEHSAGTVLL